MNNRIMTISICILLLVLFPFFLLEREQRQSSRTCLGRGGLCQRHEDAAKEGWKELGYIYLINSYVYIHVYSIIFNKVFRDIRLAQVPENGPLLHYHIFMVAEPG